MNNILNILTDEEKDFIKKYEINPSDIYDARGEIVKVYHDKAKALGCKFVINSCIYGHRLKDRNGHCIVCHPKYITYQKREINSGILYIAQYDKFCKVGIIESKRTTVEALIKHREYQLNSEDGYGGFVGWKIPKYWIVDKYIGKVEREAHNLLNDYKVDGLYWHSAELTSTTELFKCSLEKAEEAVLMALEINKK
jgi:hypothetical protein